MTPTTIDFSKYAAREDARHASFADGQAGGSIEHYRQVLAAIQKRREAYDALSQHIAKLEGDIDAATELHAKTCEPLQLELERDDLLPADRIATRIKVQEANERLEQSIAAARKAIAAAEEERGLLASRGVSNTPVENAVANTGTVEEQERVRALRKAIELVKALTFNTRKASEAAHADLTTEQQRRKRGESGRYDLGDLERNARFSDEVARLVSGFENSLADQINEIRQARIKELYAS